MIAVTGRVQREGEVVHVIARTLTDLSPLLRSVSERDSTVPPKDQDDRVIDAGTPDAPRRLGIKVRTRDFH